MKPLNLMPLLMVQMLKLPAMMERILILFSKLIVIPRVLALHLILETQEFMVSNAIMMLRWTFQNLKGECSPMNSLVGLTPLSESLITRIFQDITR
jgi:hypothetical protein